MKKLGVILFAKLNQLLKDMGEAVGIINASNKKIQESSRKVSASIENTFGQGAKAGIQAVSEQLEIQKDIYRDMEQELKALENTKAKTAKFDYRRQAELGNAINKVKMAMSDQKDIIEATASSKRDLNAQLAAGRSRAEDNAQAMEALGRAVNAAAMATLLLGDDNKKLQPAINAVRLVMAGASAAMALYNLSLRENNVLTMLGTKLQRAFVVVAGTGTAAMQTFRVALASTGIGLLVVAIGALIGKMMEATDATTKFNDALKQTEKDNKFTIDSLSDANDAVDRVTQQQILLAKLAGKSEKDIQAIREQGYAKQIENLEKQIDSEFRADAERQKLNSANIKDADERNKANAESFSQYYEAKRQIEKQITSLEQQAVIERLQMDLNEKTKRDEALKKETERRKKELEQQLKDYIQYQKQMAAEGVRLQQMLIDKMAEGKGKELAQLKLNYEQDLQSAQVNNGLKREIIEKYNRDVEGINEKYRNKEFNAETKRVNDIIQLEQSKADARVKWNKKTNDEILKEQDKFNKKIQELLNQSINALIQSLIRESSNAIARAFEGVSESSEISLKILKLQQKELEATMKDMEKSELDRLQARQQYLKNEEQILEQSSSNFSKLFKGILLSIADFLIELGTGLIVAAAATKAFKDNLLKNPKVAAAAGIAAVAAGLATKAIIARGPKFANGGIVSGPTLGLVGEYPGASTNPEVIAPLDKLKSMIGGTSEGGNFVAETRISGRDLALVLSRYNKDAQRG